MGRDYTSVSIPSVLFKKLQERIAETGFTSVSSYVTYVIRQILSEDKTDDTVAFSTEDEDRIKARLRSLGYLDWVP